MAHSSLQRARAAAACGSGTRVAAAAAAATQQRLWLAGATPAPQQRNAAAWAPQSGSLRRRGAVARSAKKETLPIFPLSVVALPYSPLPLMIFEARYRVLFNTLLAGDPDVEEGLVQEDSPYAGSRRFGMCYLDEGGRLCAIGTTLEIEHFVREPGGRMYVTNKGVERFKITKVVKERPVLLCEVEVLEEDEDASAEAKQLADEVSELFRNVFQLHVKMMRMRSGAAGGSGGGLGSSSAGSSAGLGSAAGAAAGAGSSASGSEEAAAASESMDEAIAGAKELTEYSPQQLSYWIAHAFTDSRYTQQALLEENSTLVRLGEEKRLLEKTLMYYRAATAVEGVFGSGSSSGSSGNAGGSDKSSGGGSGSSRGGPGGGGAGSGGDSPTSSSGSSSAKPSEAPQPPAGGPD